MIERLYGQIILSQTLDLTAPTKQPLAKKAGGLERLATESRDTGQ